MIALVVAAHGDGDDSQANKDIWVQAEHAAKILGLKEFTATFHKGTPAFRDALEDLSAPEVVVVPMMAAAGYYCKGVLPRELMKGKSVPGKSIRFAKPIGTSPSLQEFAVQRVESLLEETGYEPQDSGLLVVGHGTKRHPYSCESTNSLTELLRQRFSFETVSSAFLDGDPGLEPIIQEWLSSGVKRGIVLPFLMASGTHSVVDIPQTISKLPGLVVDKPLGSWSAVSAIIAERARQRPPYLNIAVLGGAE